MSKRELAINAVISTLKSSATFEVQRNTPIPTTALSTGLIVVRDGESGEPEVTMSPTQYHYEHKIDLEVFGVGANLDTALDLMLESIATALEANTTLNGAVDNLYLTAPDFDLTIDSSIRCKAAIINVVVFYSTNSPLK